MLVIRVSFSFVPPPPPKRDVLTLFPPHKKICFPYSILFFR